MKEEEESSRKILEDRFRALSRNMEDTNKTNSNLMSEVSQLQFL